MKFKKTIHFETTLLQENIICSLLCGKPRENIHSWSNIRIVVRFGVYYRGWEGGGEPGDVFIIHGL